MKRVWRPCHKLMEIVVLVILCRVLFATPQFFERSTKDEQFTGDYGSDNQENEENEVCCSRLPRMKTIGKSAITRTTIEADIGRCRRHCTPKRQLRKKEFQKMMQDNPTLDPKEIYHTYSAQSRRDSSCPPHQMCDALTTTVEKFHTAEGVVSVSIIETCGCVANAHSCIREPRLVTFNKASPLETTIDVGNCRGHCSQDYGCKPVETRKVSVEGPNGAECVSIIENCFCSPPCYKASVYEQYYDYSDMDNPTIKVIDIGQCLGECEAEAADHCVFRDMVRDECLMSLVGRNTQCGSVSLKFFNVTDISGKTKQVPAVLECGCT